MRGQVSSMVCRAEQTRPRAYLKAAAAKYGVAVERLDRADFGIQKQYNGIWRMTCRSRLLITRLSGMTLTS
jgi:hypothetical protein